MPIQILSKYLNLIQWPLNGYLQFLIAIACILPNLHCRHFFAPSLKSERRLIKMLPDCIAAKLGWKNFAYLVMILTQPHERGNLSEGSSAYYLQLLSVRFAPPLRSMPPVVSAKSVFSRSWIQKAVESCLSPRFNEFPLHFSSGWDFHVLFSAALRGFLSLESEIWMRPPLSFLGTAHT